jgi:hypothetical protein
MRWYFAIDEPGAAGQTGSDAKLAVTSALAVGGLEPVLLYHGAHGDFCEWMARRGVRIIDAAPPFLPVIREANARGTYQPHSIGHWLRVVVPLVETEQEFVLYTDCDVIFLQPPDWARIRPKIFAAAPEFQRDNWNYFNAGVMVLNVPAMQASYAAFEAHICARISSGAEPFYDDEFALNEAYRGFWDQLDPVLNWKPYWGFSAGAKILHFHGPKLNAIESMAAGHWRADNPTAEMFWKILAGHKGDYETWMSVLADRLQTMDFPLAIRMSEAASALREMPVEGPIDLGFLGFCMFPG